MKVTSQTCSPHLRDPDVLPGKDLADAVVLDLRLQFVPLENASEGARLVPDRLVGRLLRAARTMESAWIWSPVTSTPASTSVNFSSET
jgi:hypothetical protein